jgi:hypothetical protein
MLSSGSATILSEQGMNAGASTRIYFRAGNQSVAWTAGSRQLECRKRMPIRSTSRFALSGFFGGKNNA